MLGVFGLAAYRIVPSANRLMMAVINMKSYEYTLDSIEKTIINNNEVSVKPHQVKISFLESIKIRELTFQFSDATESLLNNISFEIKKGDAVGILDDLDLGRLP